MNLDFRPTQQDPSKFNEKVYCGLHEWLKNYIARIDCPDARCRYQFEFKYAHTIRVVEETKTIGRMLKLNDRDMLIARIIALLHDVGRFEQYRIFRTYNDHISLDHGVSGGAIIREAGLLGEFSTEEQNIIYNAIYWHNKHELPQNQSKKDLLFSKLIRDADKLDIIQITIGKLFRENPFGEIDNQQLTDEVSDGIYDDLMRGINVNYIHLKNETDIMLGRIGWIFDLNFVPTFCLYLQRNYFEKISAILPATTKVSEIISKIRDYIDQKADNLC